MKKQKKYLLFVILLIVTACGFPVSNTNSDPCYWTDTIVGAWRFADDPPDAMWWVSFSKGGDGFIATSNMSYECDKDTGDLIMLIDFTPPPSRVKVEFRGDDYMVWSSGEEFIREANP